MVTRSLSSNINDPSTIAAMVSKPDSGASQDNEKLLDTQITSLSQLKPEHSEENKAELGPGKKVGMSQHG